MSIGDFIKQVLAGVQSDAQTLLEGLAPLGLEEAKKLLESDPDYATWTEQLKSGDLTQDDFEFLLQGKQEAAQIDQLRVKGLAMVKIDAFKKALFNSIVSVGKTLLP